MPVGNPARKFRQRLGLCLSILRMTLTVALLCGVQGSNHITFVLDTYTIQRVILDLDEWTYRTYFLYIHRVRKAIKLFALFYLGLVKFY